jgi:Arc/MetJ family transcription regulator
MRTTIDIDDQLLKYAKLQAAKQGSSLRQVIEDALRDFLSRNRTASIGIKLETFSGNGLKPGVDLDNARSLHEIMDGR